MAESVNNAGEPELDGLAPAHDPEQSQLSPLSIQAASLVRSIDALSRIFWISLAGTFLTIFFAGLSQLDANVSGDFISLGEYQVPKSLVPLAAMLFAVFVMWLTANRLRMLRMCCPAVSCPAPWWKRFFA